MIKLYETVAKEFPQQTANYLQLVSANVLANQYTNTTLFNLLCMLEKGSGYIIQYVNYQEYYHSLLYPILTAGETDMLLLMETMMIVKSCYHLFNTEEQGQIIQICIQHLSHHSITVFLSFSKSFT